MGVFSRVEDRPTPQAVYNWRVYLSAAIAAAAAVMIGYDGAFIGTTIALPSFVAEFKFGQLSSSDVNLISANIVSCYQAGAFFGCFLAYPVGHFLGRRIGLLISAAVFCVGAALMLGVNGDRGLALLYVGRVLAGFGVGAASNLTPIYISEVSPPSIRGMLVGFYELAWQIGAVVGFWINVSPAQYLLNRWPAIPRLIVDSTVYH
jgi:MFS family permease